MANNSGIFSPKMFHHKIFDTGDLGSPLRRRQHEVIELDYEKIDMLREEREILLILMAIDSDT
ncbi:MAG: hypothetical protein GY861_02865 [bacterium]|nr:hypothetical protein [bacterium]